MDLLDRYYNIGDVVKRRHSDAQSGIVEMTAVNCDLESVYIKHPNDTLPANSFFEWCNISGSDLQSWDRYCKGDFVICQDWIGEIQRVWEEVTLLLLDGKSIVTVANPSLLEEVCESINGPRTLAHRLAQVGFIKYCYNDQLRETQNENFHPFYPGQLVRTSASNIFRGKWRRGRFDFGIEPVGTVSEVRCYRLEVSWTLPNLFKPFRKQLHPPPRLIDGDLLEKEIRVYIRNRLPFSNGEYPLPGAVYSPHFRFGRRVTWKSGATHATGGPNSDWPQIDFEPTYHSLESHLNILQIKRTRGTVIVNWQNGQVSKETSVDILPSLDTQESDLWPGDLVWLKEPQNENTWEMSLGVVQAADTTGSTTLISWLDTLQSLEEKAGVTKTAGKKTVPLDDLYKYPVMNSDPAVKYPHVGRKRGDLVIVIPDSLPSRISLNIDQQPEAFKELLNRAIEILGSHESDCSFSSNVDWLGEIVAFCLDGCVIVRLGLSSTVKDICIPLERVMLVASADDKERCTPFADQELWQSDGNSVASESDCSIDLTALPKSSDSDGNDEFSVQNMDKVFLSQIEKVMELDAPQVLDADDEDIPPREVKRIEIDSKEPRSRERIEFEQFSARALQFEILKTPAPTTHRFYNWTKSFEPTHIHRLRIECQMLSSLLPVGIYMRTWEDRPDLLRLLIIGPYHTVYKLAPFVFDFHLGSGFPNFTPSGFFHSWTDGQGRIHSKLEEDGYMWSGMSKVWMAPDESGLLGSNAILLKCFVKLARLLFNQATDYPPELGIETLKDNKERKRESENYDMRIWAMARGFIKTELEISPDSLADVICWLYMPGQDAPFHLECVLVDSRFILKQPAISAQVCEEDNVTRPKMRSAEKWLETPTLEIVLDNFKWLEEHLKDYPKAEGIEHEAMNKEIVSAKSAGLGVGRMEADGMWLTWASFMEGRKVSEANVGAEVTKAKSVWVQMIRAEGEASEGIGVERIIGAGEVAEQRKQR